MFKVLCPACKKTLGFVYFGAPNGAAQFFCVCGAGTDVKGTPEGLVLTPRPKRTA